MHDRFGLDSRIITPYAPFGATGMGFVPRLTPQEVEAAATKKIQKMSADLFIPPYSEAYVRSVEPYTNGKYDQSKVATYKRVTEAVEKFTKRRNDYMNAAKAALGGDTPEAVLKEQAFALYSTDLAKPDFDRYFSFTTRYLDQIKNLTLNGVMDSAANAIRSRVESYPLEIPFFGELSIYDIKLDNLASMNNLIDTVKTTSWTDVSKVAISTFAPKGGYADYGVKALDTAVSVANQVATLSSTIGVVGFSTGISAAIGAIVPWALAAIALIAICESLYAWLSGSAEEDEQEAQYEKAWHEADTLHGHIQELLLLSLTDTNYTKQSLNMRLNEMSAYGSTVRNSLWTDCRAITRSDKTPTAYCENPNALRSDGTNNAFVPVRHKSEKGETKKKIMMCKVEYLKSVVQYLSGFEEIGDRRLAFEYLGMTTLPNSVAFSRGLWDSDSYKRNPLKLLKPPVLSRAAQAEIQAAQAIRAARMIENGNARIAAARSKSPVLTQYSSLYKSTAKTSTDQKKPSSAPLLIGAAAASAVYLYYNR